MRSSQLQDPSANDAYTQGRAAHAGRWLAGLWGYATRDPLLTRGVLLYALFQLTAIGWDLPCIYGWENDGVAPRDLFGGIAFNLMPGNGHRYPLLHYALLALLVWPVVGLAALRARSFAFPDLIRSVLSVPSLTAIALIAKLVAVAMGCMTLLVLGRIAARTFGTTAGRCAAAFGALNLSLAYYGRVSNLDGPYLMWVALALDRVLDVFERGQARDYRAAALFAAAAVATKDQAYSAFALTLPVYLLGWPLLCPQRLPIARGEHLRRLVRAMGAGALGYGLMSGALLNPTGFVHRLELLTGGNSQDWRRYERSLAGVLANLRDLWASQADFFWPWPVVVLAWAGVLVAIAAADGGGVRRAGLRLLPLACAISSLCTFTLVVARCEHRFVLPLAFALSYYGGAAAALLLRRLPRVLAAPALAASAVLAAGPVLALHLTQWYDARNAVERWLARLPRGSVVETYGLGVYLPRFDLSADATYRVQRVAPDPPNKRPPIPGMREIADHYGNVAQRAPDVLVVSEGFATRFVVGARTGGHVVSREVLAYQRDRDARSFFARALADRLPGYTRVLSAEVHLPAWARALGLRPVHIHGSTAAKTWVLERRRNRDRERTTQLPLSHRPRHSP